MNKLPLYNVISLTAYFVVAFFVGMWAVPIVGPKLLFIGIFASWLMLMIGIQIVHFKFKKGQFIGRFLMATVFQMLAFLSLAVYFVYLKVEHVKPFLVTLVVIHMIALAVQTIFFLRQGNRMD